MTTTLCRRPLVARCPRQGGVRGAATLTCSREARGAAESPSILFGAVGEPRGGGRSPTTRNAKLFRPPAGTRSRDAHTALNNALLHLLPCPIIFSLEQKI